MADAAPPPAPPKKKKDERPDTDTVRVSGRLMRRLFALLRPYRGWVLLAVVATVGTALLGPLRPTIVQRAVDGPVTDGDPAGLLRLVGLLALVLFGEGVLAFVQAYLTQWIGQHALLDLRTRVFRHLQRQRLAFFDRTPVGRLITRTTSDVEALGDLLSAGIVTILGDFGRLVFIAYFMLALDVELGLVALLALPPMLVATEYFRRKMRDAYRETRKQVARLNSFLQEHVTGMQVVQLFNREQEEQRRFEAINDDHRVAQIRTIFYFALFWPVVDLLASVALGVVIWYGGGQALRDALTVGTLIAFIQYVRMFFEPVRNLSDQLNTLQGALAAAERVFGVLDTDQALPERADPTPLPVCRGRIEFRDVWFAYDRLPLPEDAPADAPEPDWNWVLKGVSFTAEPGQTLALVGATGSGKTTIISLLLRFYEIQQGQILVDGIDIRDLKLEELRRHIGLVLQDVFLFSGTVEENVTLGDPTKTLEQVRRAAQLVGADAFVERLPGGYQHPLGERGATLSQGQRQLVSFVRTLVYDPAILVLDEATSSVDTETEEMVQHAVEVLMEGRTALVVAHRLSTVQHAHQILVLHKGEVRERGSHQALLAQDGLYRRLYELQFAAQERAAA
ncbi:MAG TPA: ABC transporter ATP-binding protein [Rubricoccaceae bacterium]|nr:ABC transporter ATP-binding protein [Rubricoccaceae bacterium]